jgi:superfamily I DNA/RNA helicase
VHFLQLRDRVCAAAAAGGPALRKLIETSIDACVAIVGAPGSGKTTALLERVERARAEFPGADPLHVDATYGLDAYAVSLLAAEGADVTLVDDVDAELQFAAACAPLFALEWPEFAQDQLDPEVPGLRSPERFLASAFRLIRRLRDAGVTPGEFLTAAQTGATNFYAKPPNFADPSLLAATKGAYHDSLDVDHGELERQRKRELDLAKILARLYEAYVQLVETTRRMTGRDAVIAAARRVGADAALAARLRDGHRVAFVDEAQDLTNAQLSLLTAIFGEELAGVTLCGDPAAAISPVRMTRPERTFARATSRVELERQNGLPRLECERPATPLEEARLIADRVAAWLAEGVAPSRIAVLFRSVRNVQLYEAALLDRGVPAVVTGDANVFEDRRVLDALAVLWNVHDPFRHDWLLRTLSNPAVGLSDASLAILCGEPADPQRQLFAFEDEAAPTLRPGRWDAKRDLRLGWNVIRGERDDALSPDAAERVRSFRRMREAWLRRRDSEAFETFARTVWREGLAREGEPGSARAVAQQAVLRRLLARLNEFVARSPGASLADVLHYAEQRKESDLEACSPPAGGEEFVQLRSVEAARGLHFERVVVANIRPGAFPLWYSPDAFLFSPRLGVIPKENSGAARASRTAKFSYYTFAAKTARSYYDAERRAFNYALRRSGAGVLVTASGTPTRGVSAPELLEELR